MAQCNAFRSAGLQACRRRAGGAIALGEMSGAFQRVHQPLSERTRRQIALRIQIADVEQSRRQPRSARAGDVHVVQIADLHRGRRVGA